MDARIFSEKVFPIVYHETGVTCVFRSGKKNCSKYKDDGIVWERRVWQFAGGYMKIFVLMVPGY